MENRRKRKMMKEIGYFVAIFLILSIPLYYVVKIITTTIIEERQEDITIKGAGSGVGLPLYDDWFKRYGNEEGIYIVYNKLEWRQSLLNLFLLSKRSSFSGGEQTLKEEELRANGLQQIPIAGSSVALIYHFPPGQINSSYQLNLTIDLITQIYNGSIIYWNDPSVMALNPQLNNFHFDTRIVPIYFTEENGATLLFTSGLSRTSPWWALNIGSGLTVDWPIENGVVSSVTSSVEMLLSVNATNWSIGYVIYSDILNRDLIGYNLDLPSMANLCTISTTSKCLHNLTLTLPISLQSFEFNTLNTSNNEVVFPPVNFTLTPNLWPFSGYSYYIINTTYYFPSGCSTFLGNFQNFFNWLANSPIAQSQATLLGYYFNTTYFTELNYQPLECYYPLPSPTPYSVVAVLLLIALLMSLFGLRYLCVHRKKSSIERFEDFSIKLEVSPLLTKAKIDSADVTLLEQIGSGSFGEVYKGKWKGTDVAVKRILLKSQSDEDSILEEFFKEVHLMSTLRHPHIVKVTSPIKVSGSVGVKPAFDFDLGVSGEWKFIFGVDE